MITIGKDRLTIEALVDAAYQRRGVTLCNAHEFVDRIQAGADLLDKLLAEGTPVYGVTTGYGDSCTETVGPEYYNALPLNLTRYHGCGLGAYLDDEAVRAVMIVRLNTLAYGFSGVSIDLLRAISFFIEKDILPRIPEEGSVGASGDLTPLSYLAGALAGEREVRYRGETVQAAQALASVNREPYRFRPKEAIAVMNGTAVMNALGAIAFSRARYLADLACRITALNTLALRGNPGHFHPRLFAAKPHAGQAHAAARIFDALGGEGGGGTQEKIQDPYSLRCAPHVIGLFYDMADTLRQFIETEMNSANDNPLIDPQTGKAYHGGHFYGGHIALAMDTLKTVTANLADLLDRQLALLVDPKYNRGLPSNLTGSQAGLHHGFKAVQIGSSAWAAEALKNTMPASVFSRSTECHNQDKVSMGTIAARDCLRVIELTGQTFAACLLAAAQALHLRGDTVTIPAPAAQTLGETLAYFTPLTEDRPLEQDLRRTCAHIEASFFNVFSPLC
ncbi:MAG: aromatic amino acid ammonia-lyase [Spirochaetaceae bacterium]|jgi:histidine ammonia-lyase|nr:aromatic amino acid ammonia-lyase [Spirochaetaceae bacterium]